VRPTGFDGIDCFATMQNNKQMGFCYAVESSMLEMGVDIKTMNAEYGEGLRIGLASLGLDIGIFCDFIRSILILNVILELYFLGLALSRPQVRRGPARDHLRPAVRHRRPWSARAGSCRATRIDPSIGRCIERSSTSFGAPSERVGSDTWRGAPADCSFTFKNGVKQLAAAMGMHATFMAKPLQARQARAPCETPTMRLDFSATF
jgi:hypothetical protein